MSASGGDAINTLNRISDVGNIDNSLTKIIFLPIAAAGVQSAAAVTALFGVFVTPITALGDVTAELINSLVGGAARVVGAGSGASATGVEAFGIAGFPLGIAIVGVGLYLLARVLASDETSDAIPFTFTDFPLIGVDEESEGND